jgi:carboxypeptidase D
VYVIVLIISTGAVPSAASFYVGNLPDLHQDKHHPLHIYAGHIESDPHASPLSTNVSAHLFFVLVKARRTADKERVMFWFNVCVLFIMQKFF